MVQGQVNVGQWAEGVRGSRIIARRGRRVRLNLPSTHVPLFHAWRP